MVESAYLMECVAGLFFLVASYFLLRRASRTRETPERLLGMAFLLMGISYALSMAPFVFDLASLFSPLSLAGRITFDAGVILIARFTRHEFHRDADWAKWLVYGSALLLAAGIGLSVHEGDLAGYYPLVSTAFWLEWVGLVIPFAWLGAEAYVHYVDAHRRMRLGICDPLVCNRFLLWGLFAFIEICACLVLVPLYMVYETESLWTAEMDTFLGTIEILTVVVSWFAFFPPVWYRRWIRGVAPAATAEAR